MIETGQDPRRFTEDLLRRLRDLVIVSAVPDAPATGLIDVSEDQGERLVAQAARFGAAELSRAADIVATGLTEMRGATAPRLLLELICARVLLPGADHATDGVLARLDRLEKRARDQRRRAAPTPRRAPRRQPAAAPVAGPATPAQPTGRGGRARADPSPSTARRSAPDPPPEARARAARPSHPGPSRGPAPVEPEPRRPQPAASGRAHPGRRTPAVARHRRGDQAAPPGGLDAPHPELPGRRRSTATR